MSLTPSLCDSSLLPFHHAQARRAPGSQRPLGRPVCVEFFWNLRHGARQTDGHALLLLLQAGHGTPRRPTEAEQEARVQQFDGWLALTFAQVW